MSNTLVNSILEKPSGSPGRGDIFQTEDEPYLAQKVVSCPSCEDGVNNRMSRHVSKNK
jgi:hypothetical protein